MILTCPRCGSTHVVEDPLSHKIVCTSCGFVLEESPIDYGPEWRSYTPEDRVRRSRVGAPLTSRVADGGLTTFIRSRGRDLRSRKLQALQARLRIESQDKKLVELLSLLNDTAARLNMPTHVIETAARFAKMLVKVAPQLLRRNELDYYVAALLAIASKLEGWNYTIKEISRRLNLRENKVWSTYRKILSYTKVRLRPRSPKDFVQKITAKLHLSTRVERLSYRLLRLLHEVGLEQGKPPEAVAGSAIYISSILLDEKRNQTQVARAIGMTDATIRNRYRDIVDNFYIEVKL
ncbi:MAG: transcription initiation factor IIB family protein [Crenarchaeota archaeon]|nr:transcription initiation factor IIB family protein [Thermoproteota archaeon]